LSLLNQETMKKCEPWERCPNASRQTERDAILAIVIVDVDLILAPGR